MRPPDPLAIACAADYRYIQPLTVMLQSVLTNLSSDRTINVFLIDGGIDEAHRQELTRIWNPQRGQLHWLFPPTAWADGLPLWGRMPVTTYYKLLIADLLPRSFHRVIWLDCDLVVDRDLSHLWDTDLAGRHALAVPDRAIPLVSSRNGVAHYRQLAIREHAKYFNAGVMVVNLDLWRKEGVPARVLAYLRRYRDSVVFWDQEGLNAVLADKWGELDPRWNVCVHTMGGDYPESPSTPDDRPWIVHFTGNLKPWIYPSNNPAHALYFQYLDLTAWAGWRPKSGPTRRLIRMYEWSGLRELLLPAEEWVMKLVRGLTRKYASEGMR